MNVRPISEFKNFSAELEAEGYNESPSRNFVPLVRGARGEVRVFRNGRGPLKAVLLEGDTFIVLEEQPAREKEPRWPSNPYPEMARMSADEAARYVIECQGGNADEVLGTKR
jgi:hypothetical protein